LRPNRFFPPHRVYPKREAEPTQS